MACMRNHGEVQEQLLRHVDIAVNQPNQNNVTPLLMACYFGNENAVERLLKCKTTLINLAGNNGRTALFLASQQGHYKVVALLLKYNAKPNLADQHLVTPLFIACQEGRTKVAKLLTNCPWTLLDFQKYNGWTPLDITHAAMINPTIIKDEETWKRYSTIYKDLETKGATTHMVPKNAQKLIKPRFSKPGTNSNHTGKKIFSNLKQEEQKKDY